MDLSHCVGATCQCHQELSCAKGGSPLRVCSTILRKGVTRALFKTVVCLKGLDGIYGYDTTRLQP
jgi:hypothetical protein